MNVRVYSLSVSYAYYFIFFFNWQQLDLKEPKHNVKEKNHDFLNKFHLVLPFTFWPELAYLKCYCTGYPPQ